MAKLIKLKKEPDITPRGEKILETPQVYTAEGNFKYKLFFYPDGQFNMEFETSMENLLAMYLGTKNSIHRMILMDRDKPKDKKMPRKDREAYTNGMYAIETVLSTVGAEVKKRIIAEHNRKSDPQKIIIVPASAPLHEK